MFQKHFLLLSYAQVQRAVEAEKRCNKLLQQPFAKCHNIVDPHPYVETCKYDVCACGEKLNCFCSAMSRYSEACAKQGVDIQWRNPSVSMECGLFIAFIYNSLPLHIPDHVILL